MTHVKFTLTAIAIAGLVGCGGGGSGDPGGAPTAQGLYVGQTNTNRTVTGIVLSDGTYYVLYSSVNNPSLIAGVTQGSGSESGSTFASQNLRDFNLEGLGVSSGALSGTFRAKASFNGGITYANGSSVTLASTYSAAYEQAPSLAALAGTYAGQVASSSGVQNATFTIASSGAIAGNAGACTATGTATPRTDGNVFNASITFGAAPCAFPGQSFNGVIYYDAPNKRAYAAAPNAARTDGVLFVGIKP